MIEIPSGLPLNGKWSRLTADMAQSPAADDIGYLLQFEEFCGYELDWPDPGGETD